MPDNDQLIMVYCRSGRRSKEVAEKLVKLGYTNIVEFGAILDWTGEIVTGNKCRRAIIVPHNQRNGANESC